MGLFSKKITTVSSVIYPLGEEPDAIEDVVKTAVITASLQKTSIPQAIKTSLLDGIGVKISQGFNYASRDYYAGMPNALPFTFREKSDPVLEILSDEYLTGIFSPDVIEVESTTVTYENDYQTVVRTLIFDDYSYDFYEDEAFASTGSIDVGAVLTLTGPFEDTVGHPGEVGYTLLFTNPDTSTVTINEWYDESLFTAAKETVQRVVIEYTRDGGPKETISYRHGGSDARLNLFLRTLTEPVSNTFPAMVLKRDNVYLDEPGFVGTNALASTRSYGRRFGINIDDMISRVRENPDEDDIDFAFIQPGTLINATNKEVVKYHFNYFNYLRLNMPDNEPVFNAWVAAHSYPAVSVTKRNKAENAPAQSIRLADPDNPTGSVDMEIAWRYISYSEHVGVVDEYEVECGPQETITSRYSVKIIKSEEYDATNLYLRKALSPTTYAEICVCGLWHENYVYKGKSVQSGVWDAFNDVDGDFGSGFLIPLDYGIFLTLSPRERLQFGQECFHVIFNCYKVVKQKWYQTGIFKVILTIISIAVVYFTWGTTSAWVSGFYNTVLTATSSALVATLVTGAVMAATFVGVSFVAKEVGQWAAEKWGAFWGALVQITAAVLLTKGIGSLPGMPKLTPVNLIEQVAKASSYILMGLSAYTEHSFMALQEEQEAWQDYLNKPDDALQQVTEMMEEMFPDLNIVQKALLPNPESLDEFLGRTLTTTDGLTGRLLMPITDMVELTLTPRLT